MFAAIKTLFQMLFRISPRAAEGPDELKLNKQGVYKTEGDKAHKESWRVKNVTTGVTVVKKTKKKEMDKFKFTPETEGEHDIQYLRYCPLGLGKTPWSEKKRTKVAK